MLKIQDAVDAVFSAMRLRGIRENTLAQTMRSVYKPIIDYHCQQIETYISKNNCHTMT